MANGQIGLGLNGQQPFGIGLNGWGSHLRQVTLPGLKIQPSLRWPRVILKFAILKFDLKECKYWLLSACVRCMNMMFAIVYKPWISCLKTNFKIIISHLWLVRCLSLGLNGWKAIISYLGLPWMAISHLRPLTILHFCMQYLVGIKINLMNVCTDVIKFRINTEFGLIVASNKYDICMEAVYTGIQQMEIMDTTPPPALRLYTLIGLLVLVCMVSAPGYR